MQRDYISREVAVNYLNMPHGGAYTEEAKGWAVNQILAVPSVDAEDVLRQARNILWERCKNFLRENTSEEMPVLHPASQTYETYTLMTNEVQALTRAINIVKEMKWRE